MQPLKQTKLVETVVESLIDSISKGVYKPGDRLPSLEELVRMTSVSRNTLREALTRLESMGVLRIKQGDGTYVNKIDINTMVSRILPLLMIGERSLRNMLEAREAIEMQTVFLAAKRADRDHIAILKGIIDEMANSLDNPEHFTELDFQFHYEVAAATENDIFTQFLLAIHDAMQEQQKRIARLPEVAKISFGYHQRIFEAISSHDAATAQALMKEHIENIPYRLLKNPELDQKSKLADNASK